MECKRDNMKPVIDLSCGSLFKKDDGIFIKLRNPKIPMFAKISDYPVWAVDIGNGHIEKIYPYERVEYITKLVDLISRVSIGVHGKTKLGISI